MQAFNRLPRWGKIAALGAAAVGVYLCFVLGLFAASRLNPSPAPGPSAAAGGPSTGSLAAAPTPPGGARPITAAAAPGVAASPLPGVPPPSATAVAATATPAPSRTPTPVAATATPAPSRTPTLTATRPPTTEPGVPTATVATERLIGARRSTQPSAKTGILVKISNAEGKPMRGTWASASQQKADLNGNPILGDEVAQGRTDNAGTLVLPVPPGTYAIRLGDIAGDTWGDPFNFAVTSGNVTVLDVNLARLLLGVTDADGKGVGSRYTTIRKQKKDLSGNPIKGDEIANGRTDDTGVKLYDLFPGVYAISIYDIAGYPWGDDMNHALPAGETTSRIVSLGRLAVGVQDADKKALPGRYVSVRLQKKDLEGKPIKGDRIAEGRTSDTGLVDWNLTEGLYAVEISDIAGARWGEELNHPVKSGATSTITVTLGRLTVGLKDAAGKAIAGRYAAAYLPKQDVSGSAIKGDRVAEGRTDDRGLLSFDLTPGEYIVDIENIGTLRQAPVVAGQTTVTDGATIQ